MALDIRRKVKRCRRKQKRSQQTARCRRNSCARITTSTTKCSRRPAEARAAVGKSSARMQIAAFGGWLAATTSTSSGLPPQGAGDLLASSFIDSTAQSCRPRPRLARGLVCRRRRREAECVPFDVYDRRLPGNSGCVIEQLSARSSSLTNAFGKDVSDHEVSRRRGLARCCSASPLPQSARGAR